MDDKISEIWSDLSDHYDKLRRALDKRRKELLSDKVCIHLYGGICKLDLPDIILCKNRPYCNSKRGATESEKYYRCPECDIDITYVMDELRWKFDNRKIGKIGVCPIHKIPVKRIEK